MVCSCVLQPTLQLHPPTSLMPSPPFPCSPQRILAAKCLDLPPRLPTQSIPTIHPGPAPRHSASRWQRRPKLWKLWKPSDKDASDRHLWQLYWWHGVGAAVSTVRATTLTLGLYRGDEEGSHSISFFHPLSQSHGVGRKGRAGGD